MLVRAERERGTVGPSLLEADLGFAAGLCIANRERERMVKAPSVHSLASGKFQISGSALLDICLVHLSVIDF